MSEKHRPSKFAEVIGQDPIVEVLKAVVTRNKYGSAYLFSGPTGTGKTTLGRIFSKAVLCDDMTDGEPCGTCESCKLFAKQQHFGYIELDSASVGGKDDMIKLRNEASFLSVVKKKIILLDECHDISKAGQDALLEQVEQCPEHLIYIFCTTDPDKMKKPLRDRCMQFQFVRVDQDLITKRLKLVCSQEKLIYEEDALKTISLRSEGHVRNALNLLEEVAYLGPITIKNLDIISRDYNAEIFNILLNLGKDLSKVMESYKLISSYLTPFDFYNQLLTMVSESCKVLYGYENIPKAYREYALKLKEVHGYSLLEFLNYLISRDKFIDKIGIQSDLIVLHYKFGSNSFVQREPQKIVATQNQISTQNAPVVQNTQETNQNAPSLSFDSLRKMDLSDRTKALRDHQMRNKKSEQEDPQRIPAVWPLPKERRVGENSLDEEELTPEEFSRLLVGGRGGAS